MSVRGNEEADRAAKSASTEKKIPFLELLLKLKGDNKAFETDNDIREELDTFMFEGHDTTAASLCFTITLLSKHPEVQELLYEELTEILRDKLHPSYEDLHEAKYLDRVIKESLRLFPSVPSISREITEKTELPSGYTLPVGCVVILSLFSLHRNEKYFSSPLEFNPDNFLLELSAKRHPFSYLPFSAGPRNCIGQKFALTEMKSLLSKLILRYKIEDANTDIRPETDVVLQSANGHNIVLKERKTVI